MAVGMLVGLFASSDTCFLENMHRASKPSRARGTPHPYGRILAACNTLNQGESFSSRPKLFFPKEITGAKHNEVVCLVGHAAFNSGSLCPNRNPRICQFQFPGGRVYVTRPTHLDGFDVSSSGKLTPVPGSPFSNIDLFHLSVNSKYLFGESDDHAHIITYAIESNGAVKQLASFDAQGFSPEGGEDCCDSPQKLDASGTTLYTIASGANYWLDNFKIESSGELSFIGSPFYFGGGEEVGPGLLSVLGNNKFAYATSCNDDVPQDSNTIGFKRESSGLLEGLSTLKFQLPEPKSGDVYCSYNLATDPSDHLVIAISLWNVSESTPDGPVVLASYTADSEGNLATKSTASTMPVTTGGTYMSISPSGKLLAVDAGNGFQVFHFNGADPITKFTDVLHSSETFIEFGWDKSNHLFALSQNALHVYSATSTSIKEEAGSPYSIPEASSVIVRSLN
jgi:hypothetical protein